MVNRFGYRRVLVASTLGLAAVSLLFMLSARPAGITYCRWSCFCRG
nr:Putative multidrug resistance protein MdtD [Klebsiella pneumoniae]